MTEYKEHPAYAGYFAGRDGSVIGRAGHVLKPNANGKGYVQMVMCLPGNKRKTVTVHRLVCETFHGPRPSQGHVVAHADGNSLNNAADNLRWATAAENEADKRQHGRTAEADGHGKSRLSADLVRKIRKARARGQSYSEMARYVGANKATIREAAIGRTWGSVR